MKMLARLGHWVFRKPKNGKKALEQIDRLLVEMYGRASEIQASAENIQRASQEIQRLTDKGVANELFGSRPDRPVHPDPRAE